MVGVFIAGITLGEEGVIHYRNGFYMAVGVKWAGPGFRVFLRGCPRGSSCGIGRLLVVISICNV